MTIDLDLQSLLNILLLLGVMQGFIVSFLLLFVKRPRSSANLFLAFWVLALVLSNLRIVIDTESLYRLWGQQVTLMMPLSFSLFYGPLLYFFIRKISEGNFNFQKRHFWHLLPGVLEFTYYLIIYLQPVEYKQWFFGQIHWKWIEPGLEVTAVVLFTFYLLRSVRILRQYKQLIHERFSATDIDTYDWLRRLALVLISLLAMWVILTFIDVAIMNYRLPYAYFYPYYIAITYISYFIGYAGYFRPETVILRELKPETVIREVIDADKLNSLTKKLQVMVIKESLFLNPRIKAADVALKLEVSVQTLSYVLNKGVGMSFSDYINSLRVDHVKDQLKTADLELMSLMGIAQESGFNSESSFYRIFKQTTGMTPKAYLQSLQD